MKTLLLMRHAKSSWKDPDVTDHERQLNKRGRKDAPMMGKLLLDRELVPELILSSTAQRARLTVESLIEATGYTGEVEYVDAFYMGEPINYLEKISTLPNHLQRVMVVGHNPGLEGLVQILSHRVESLSTAAVAYLVLPVQDWGELNGETEGELVELWRPRDLREKSKK